MIPPVTNRHVEQTNRLERTHVRLCLLYPDGVEELQSGVKSLTYC